MEGERSALSTALHVHGVSEVSAVGQRLPPCWLCGPMGCWPETVTTYTHIGMLFSNLLELPHAASINATRRLNVRRRQQLPRTPQTMRIRVRA